MLKKIFAFAILISIISVFNVSYADYPQYLNGNRNFILCDGHMGEGRYVDASSLNSEVYSPPQYVISIDIVSVPDADRGRINISSRSKVQFFYDLNDHHVYVRTATGIRILNPNGTRASGANLVRAAEIAFELAYKIKFNAR